ncbi:MAG TPA: VTT domain-containing protein [Candidatus Polarisedimenticolaceae bacterium]|nr:VTT domain-containing protein [Candidatus Polarisedimenticolaceae bacterium]
MAPLPTVHASRLGFLVDGSAYYPAFAEAVERARHSVLITGWDIHSKIPLRKEAAPPGLPDTLAAFLDAVARRTRGLHVHILTWDFAMLYALERETLPLLQLGWRTHRRVHFHLDGAHPLGACRHQKIVVVDDRVAFLGGFDLAGSRWDTPEHLAGDPRRVHGDGTPYGTFHDVQAVVEGEVAAALGEMIRTRWREAEGKRLDPPPGHGDPWPPSATAALHDVPVSLARTEPAYQGAPEMREVEAVLLEAVARARGHLFLETQYFTSNAVGEALGAALERPDGPEVVAIVPAVGSGWLEEATMGSLRARLLRRLRARDRHGRFRCWYPAAPGLTHGVNIHSKVVEADGTFLTVGSANLSNRSMGFDSEVNLVLQAGGREDVAAAVAGLRNRLLGEHLGVPAEEIAARVAAHGSLLAAVEPLRGKSGRTLEPVPLPPEGPLLAAETPFLDPERPVPLDRLVEQFAQPDAARSKARGPLLRLALVLVLLAGLAAAWQFTPLSHWIDPARLQAAAMPLRDRAWAPLAVLLAYVLGGFLMVPVLLLIVAGGVVFGPWQGFVYGVLGSLASAVAGYGVGRMLGREGVRRLAGTRLNDVSARLGRLGTFAVVAVRLVPVAPFMIVNLIAGAVHIRPRQYVAGTLLGMTPGILLLTVFGHGLWSLMERPTAGGLLLAGGAAGLMIALSGWIRRLIFRA